MHFTIADNDRKKITDRNSWRKRLATASANIVCTYHVRQPVLCILACRVYEMKLHPRGECWNSMIEMENARRFNVQTDAFTTQPCCNFVAPTTFGAECRLPLISWPNCRTLQSGLCATADSSPTCKNLFQSKPLGDPQKKFCAPGSARCAHWLRRP